MSVQQTLIVVMSMPSATIQKDLIHAPAKLGTQGMDETALVNFFLFELNHTALFRSIIMNVTRKTKHALILRYNFLCRCR